MLSPFPQMAVVVSQDPDNYALNVLLTGGMGGQGPTLPVKVLTHGPRDALRGHYPELATPGTHGLVVFARGDARSGHWLGATDPALNDASTLYPGNGQISYHSHWSGAWYWHGSDALFAAGWPDGSTFAMGPSGSAFPSPTRHTVDQTGKRQRTAVTASQRFSGAVPAGFSMVLSHATGASLAMNTLGAVGATAAPAQPMTIAVSGGTSLTLAADGSAVLAQQSGTTITVDAGGNVTVQLGSGKTMTARGATGTVKAVRLADGSASNSLYATS